MPGTSGGVEGFTIDRRHLPRIGGPAATGVDGHAADTCGDDRREVIDEAGFDGVADVRPALTVRP